MLATSSADRSKVRTSRDSRMACLLQWTQILFPPHGVTDIFHCMHTINDTSDVDGYVDWVVDVLKWGTLVDDTASAERARELPSRTGGGAIYRRQRSKVD